MPALLMTDRKLPQTGVSSAINLKGFSAAVYIYTGKITTNYSPVLVCNGIYSERDNIDFAITV